MNSLKISLSEKTSNTFCILPWVHVCVTTEGSVVPCCRFQYPKPVINLESLNKNGLEALNTEEYNSIRTSMLEGKKINQCKKCYFEEENYSILDASSYRDHSKKQFLKHDDTFTDNKFKELRYLELSLDNICNLQCRMCSSKFSTKLITRDQKLSQFEWNAKGYTPHNKLEIDYSFLEKEDLSKLEEIKLLGGEPFMSPNFDKFLNYILNRTNPGNIRLFIATNGTHKLSEELIAKLRQFKLLRLRVSFDSYSKANDYQRFGSSYIKIWENLLEYSETFLNAEIGIHSVISTYNANKLGISIEHYKKHNIHYSLDFVRNQEMSLSYAPDNLVEWLSTQNNECMNAKQYIDNFLKNREQNLFKWDVFLKNSKILDEFYNISLKDYNPELYEFLNKNYGYN